MLKYNLSTIFKYVYRRIGPSLIRLRDGDRIEFGLGTEGSRLGVGTLPLLCTGNLQFAVARVLKMSGAADIIVQLMEDSDDSDFPDSFLAPKYFCDILYAKNYFLNVDGL